ncbi:MAG TPA: peptidase M48 family protein [Nitrospina sp.]|jgi:predicted Zn-dependent protease|nr:M48 family metallopeptidase [Nitrospinaceae bacterium]HAX46905.1 peptidase M48 family protein [Nitrospina sp.]|tara:strand:- start:2644 stop:3570 length:927 start_codon:yes stop_codon:yes gene_type:complete
MRTYQKFLAVICIGVIAACVTTPISNRSAFIMIPMGQEVALGKQAYSQILEQEEDSEDKVTTALVERTGLRIAKVSSMPNLDWEFHLIESKQQNAFALPGGKVAVYTGLLPVAVNEAGLATVMSHEIAHVIARHGAQRMTQQLVLSAGLMVASISLEDDSQRGLIMGALGVGLTYGLTLPFSRSNEAEADQIGLTYMARAGYDPNEAVRFWERFANAKDGQEMPEFLSTHPTDKTRIRRINRYLTRANIDYNMLKVKYGLGETLNIKEADDDKDDEKESEPERPQPIPGVSVETLTQLKLSHHHHHAG